MLNPGLHIFVNRDFLYGFSLFKMSMQRVGILNYNLVLYRCIKRK